eukprot:SAG31_NODE_3548_length_4138_cov_1.913528_3_plen_25_part_01
MNDVVIDLRSRKDQNRLPQGYHHRP